MKTLALAHPRIIMIAGVPGAGKSAFAKQFAEMFGVSCISGDAIRGELFAEPHHNDSEEAIIARIQDYMMQEVAKNKRSFLLDGGCNTKLERQKITTFAKNNGYETLVIWVQTSPTTAKGRATGRIRQPAGTTYHTISPELFEALSKKFSPPKAEECVVISGMHTFNTQVRMVLRKLTAGNRPAPEPQKRTATTRGIVIR